jgi:hypothetical protein
MEGGDDMKHLKITIQERKQVEHFHACQNTTGKTYREER